MMTYSRGFIFVRAYEAADLSTQSIGKALPVHGSVLPGAHYWILVSLVKWKEQHSRARIRFKLSSNDFREMQPDVQQYSQPPLLLRM